MPATRSGFLVLPLLLLAGLADEGETPRHLLVWSVRSPWPRPCVPLSDPHEQQSIREREIYEYLLTPKRELGERIVLLDVPPAYPDYQEEWVVAVHRMADHCYVLRARMSRRMWRRQIIWRNGEPVFRDKTVTVRRKHKQRAISCEAATSIEGAWSSLIHTARPLPHPPPCDPTVTVVDYEDLPALHNGPDYKFTLGPIPETPESDCAEDNKPPEGTIAEKAASLGRILRRYAEGSGSAQDLQEDIIRRASEMRELAQHAPDPSATKCEDY